MKDRRFAIFGLIGIISFVSGAWIAQDDQQQELSEKRRLFQQILSFVSEYYVDSINPSDLYDMAIDGMLRQLDDPYTSFLQTEPFEELSISTSGEYGGVGLRIDLRDGWVTVVAPLADTPAERAGLEAGDQIVEVEGKSTRGWDTQQTANVLRGEPGTETNITVVRAGFADSLRFTLTRDQIHVNSVEGATMVAPEIGYLRLNTVSAESALELRRAIAELRDDGATSMILDLRGNPGGVLEQGVALADLFLERGDVVVETKGRAQDATRTYTAEHAELWPEMPLVVLVNERTASAAEIISGSLQDHDRAVILGTPTFGKGVAYLFVRLSRTEGITVTTSRWYTPSGRSIQRIHPDPAGAQLIAGGPPRAEADTMSSMTFRTDAGRPIKTGAGGIQPDVFVRDTLTTLEQEFATALGSEIPAYRNTLTRYALDLKGSGTITDPAFRVTDEMLAQILTRLRSHEGLSELTDEAFYGARNLIGEQFGQELTRYVFGREAELRRIILDDLQAREAIDLLRSAETPDALIARATALSRENSEPGR